MVLSGCSLPPGDFTDAERRAMNEAADRLPSASYRISGLSIETPAGSGWQIIVLNGSGIAYRKTLGERHTLAATAARRFPYDRSFADPAEFLAAMGPAIRAVFEKGGTILGEVHTFNPAFGAYCVQSHLTREVPSGEDGARTALYEHWYAFTFLREDDPRAMYAISYSERSPSRTERESLRREAVAFFNGVQLVAPPQSR
jgi:hypothetical protein